MNGTVIDYNYKTKTGHIFAENSIRYPFFEKDLNAIIPVFTRIQFELYESRAVNIKPVSVDFKQTGIKQHLFSMIRAIPLF